MSPRRTSKRTRRGAAPKPRRRRAATPPIPKSAAEELRAILKFQRTSAAAVRTVRLPRATEPSFLYRPV